MGSNLSTITSQCISLQQAEITGVVFTGRFSSLSDVVHSASYPPGRRIELQRTSGSAAGITQPRRISFAYIHVVA